MFETNENKSEDKIEDEIENAYENTHKENKELPKDSSPKRITSPLKRV